MGQRIPPPFARLEDEASEDVDARGSPPLVASGTRLIVGRIAEALGVSPGVLYEVPTLEGPPRAPDEGVTATDAHLDGDCAAMLNAYRRIRDPEMRRRLLILAQEAGE
jgi:hypothetical protein